MYETPITTLDDSERAMVTERDSGGLGHYDYDDFTVPDLSEAERTRIMSRTHYAGVHSVQAVAAQRPLSADVAANAMNHMPAHHPNPATQAVHESFSV